MTKRLIKAISILLTVLMLASALFACNQSLPEETDSTSDTESNESTDSKLFPEGAFPIFNGSDYVLKVVSSDTANEAERSVAAKLRSALKSITNKTLSPSTDFLAKGESFDSNAYEILIGKTKHEESISVYNDVAYNSYGIRVVGNKMVFFFSTTAEGEELISLFTSSIKTEANGALWISKAISTSKSSSVHLLNIPKYPSNSLSTVYCDGDTTMVVAKNTDLTRFNEYCATLTENGYTEYSTREVANNYFKAYTKGNKMVYTYFSKGTGQARVIVGPLKDLPSKEIDPTPETVTPTLSFVAQSESTGNGLALIYQLPNGKFIIVDGGYYLSDKIYKKLCELQPDTRKIIIAAWFVSHPHQDHQETLENFIVQHGTEITIENIFFNYVEPEYYDNLTADDQKGVESAKEGKSVSRLNEFIRTKLPRSTNVIKPHTGQVYKFGESAEVEIIWTIEDYLPTALDRINTSSMIIRVNVAGTSTMVLADSTGYTNNIMLAMYDSYMKSDIVTLAHHGIWIDTPEMYGKIKADVLLWPANTAGAIEGYTHYYSSPAVKAALDAATDVYLAKGTDNKFELPYVIQNNKQEFMENTLPKDTEEETNTTQNQ